MPGVHWCGAWWPHAAAEYPDGNAPFKLIHVTEFLARTLRDRGATIPWRKEVRANALMHMKSREGKAGPGAGGPP